MVLRARTIGRMPAIRELPTRGDENLTKKGSQPTTAMHTRLDGRALFALLKACVGRLFYFDNKFRVALRTPPNAWATEFFSIPRSDFHYEHHARKWEQQSGIKLSL